MLTILLAGIAYVVIGVGTAALAGVAAAPAGVKGWRLAAWVLSLAVFGIQLVIERHRRALPRTIAARVALAVAFGAIGVAALGPVRSHWGEPHRLKLALPSLVAWPIITGVPAFVAALTIAYGFDRLTRRGGALREHERSSA